MGLSFEEADLLLQVTRDAAGVGSFGDQLGLVSGTLATLIPSASLSVVVVPAPGATGPGGSHVFLRGGDPGNVQLYAERYMQHDPQAAHAAMNPGVPNVLSDFIPSSRWGQDPFTGEFLPQHNLRHLLGIMLRMPDGALLSMAIHRERGGRDFEQRERDLLRLAARDIGYAAFGSLLREKVGRLATGAPGQPRSGGIVFDPEGDVVHADPWAVALCGGFAERFPTILVADARRLSGAGPTAVHERILWGRGGRGVRARSSSTAPGPRALVLTVLEPIEPGTEDHQDAVATSAGLTPRERDIARLVVHGLGNRHIGHKLGIATVTVGVHLTSIYRKCGVAGKHGLIKLLLGSGE